MHSSCSSVVATPAPGSANVRGTSAVHICIAPHAGAAGGAGARRPISDAQHYADRPGELAALNAMEYIHDTDRIQKSDIYDSLAS